MSNTPMHVHSFSPVVDERSTVLILGSMPGKASLLANEYYAHPRNVLWKILGTLLEFDPGAPYRERLEQLLSGGVALWDVLKTCTRSSSLDSDIVDSSSVPNDLSALFSKYPAISAVFFNGAKAESAFGRLVVPSLPGAGSPALLRLPSTSPANASIPYPVKLEKWRAVRLAAGSAGKSGAASSPR